MAKPANKETKTQGNRRSFFQRIRREVEPIVNHAIVVILLEATLLLIGLLALKLEEMFPNRHDDFYYIQTADVWICLALLSEFGLYTLVLVAIRLFKGLQEAVQSDDG